MGDDVEGGLIAGVSGNAYLDICAGFENRIFPDHFAGGQWL